MIPPFENDVLPPGVHVATWSEIETAFGFSGRRKSLLVGLRSALLALKDSGCRTAWLDGSFVTAKQEPGDFDMVWDPGGVDGNALDPVLLDLQPPRIAQHIKYGGDIFPNVVEQQSGLTFVEFFQIHKETGGDKGIVAIDLTRFTP